MDQEFPDGVIDEAQREELESRLIFEALPQVSRVVFTATPHRGTDRAGGFIGSLGSALFELPNVDDSIESLSRAVGWTSIDYLAADSWQLRALLDLPVSEDLAIHSIIANKDGSALIESSDGLVSYESSHLEQARSELVVRSKHKLTQHPEVIEELRRILYLHLDERETVSK